MNKTITISIAVISASFLSLVYLEFKKTYFVAENATIILNDCNDESCHLRGTIKHDFLKGLYIENNDGWIQYINDSDIKEMKHSIQPNEKKINA